MTDSKRQAPQRLRTSEQGIEALRHYYLQQSQRLHPAPAALFLTGAGGTGKSTLLGQFAEQLRQQGGILLQASCTPSSQHIPYHVFKQSFAHHLQQRLSTHTPEQLSALARTLRERLGSQLGLLIAHIPELRLLDPLLPDFPQVQVQNRLYEHFGLLLQVLFPSPKQPVVFLVDNLQWADLSSLNLLKSLLVQQRFDALLLVAAYRQEEADIASFVQELGQQGLDQQQLALAPWDPQEIAAIVEDTFKVGRCSPELAEVVFELSQGDPTYVRSLLEGLRRSNLVWLRHDLWQADRYAIKAHFKDMSVLELLELRMRTLSARAQELLRFLACIGGGYPEGGLEQLMELPAQAIGKLLSEGQEHGLLEQQPDGAYRFAEHYFQALLYDMVPTEARERYHYEIARMWLQQPGGDDHCLMAAHHYQKARRWVEFLGEEKLFARLHLQAGELALGRQAYEMAAQLFKAGTDMLRHLPTTVAQELCTELYLRRAHCEYLLGNYDLAERHLDPLLDQVADASLRTRIYEQKLLLSTHQGHYAKAVGVLAEALQELGVHLPLQEEERERHIRQLQQELEQLLLAESPPSRERERHLQVLSLLSAGGMSLHHSASRLMLWQTLYIITTSLRHGKTGVTALAFASYARMLQYLDGDVDRALALGRRGIALIGTLQDHARKCRTYGVYAFYVNVWKRPPREALPLLEQGLQAGLQSGDLLGAYILYTHVFNTLLLSGHSLEQVNAYRPQLQGVPEATYYIAHYQRTLLQYLSGQLDFFQLPEARYAPLAAGNTSQEERFYRHYVLGQYYFFSERFDLALQAFQEADRNSVLQKGSLLDPENAYLQALCIGLLLPSMPAEACGQLLQTYRIVLERLQRHALHAPSYFGHKVLLLQALLAYREGKLAQAEACFAEGIAQAQEHGFLQHTAIGQLLRFYMLLESAPDKASKALRHTLAAFEAWGAVTKVQHLRQQYAYMLGEQVSPSWSRLRHIEYVQRTLSGAQRQEPLMAWTVNLLLRHCAASRCVLLLCEQGQWVVSAEARVQGPLLVTGLQTPLLDYGQLPLSVLYYAMRSKQKVLIEAPDELQDLVQEREYMRQQGVRTLMCRPMLLRGEVVGLVYMENHFAPRLFDDHRRAWARIIIGQALAALDGVRSYQEVLALNRELEQEMQRKEELHQQLQYQSEEHLSGLIAVQDAERKRIAQDLHDSLGALLSGLRLQFNSLQDQVAQYPEIRERYQLGMQLADQAVREVRRIAHNMEPSSLSRFGLEAALHGLAEQLRAGGLQVQADVFGLADRLPSEQEVMLYRICQELCQNTIKHAQATQLDIQLTCYGEEALNLIVSDNGRGFDPAAIVHGMGLYNISSRVRKLSGKLEVDSAPGRGSSFLIDIPLGKKSE